MSAARQGRNGFLQRADGWLLAEAPAERLATLRVVIGGFVTIWLIASVGEVARAANRSATEFDAVGVARLLRGSLPDVAVWIGFVVVVLCGVAVTVGRAHRLTGPVFGLGVLAWTSYHSSWGQLLHFEHLLTLHVLILGFAPAADALVVGPSRRRRTTPGPSVRYGWPVRLLAITTVTTYLLSGIAKLRWTGLDWFGDEVLADHIAYSATRIERIGGPTPPLAGWVLANSWVLPPLAAAALAVELGAPLALADRRLRNVWVVAAIAFHAATGLTMWVFFGYRGLGVGLLPLFAVERVVNRVARPRASRDEAELDGPQQASLRAT